MPSRQSEVVLELLHERGPLTAEELGPELAQRGVTRARDPIAAARNALRWRDDVVALDDGRWMALIWALEGVVFPHRVTDRERERCCLRLDPDLTALASLVRTGAIRSPAGHLEIVADVIRDDRLDPVHAVPDRFLSLPYGVGRALVPDSLLGLRISGGTLELLLLGDDVPASSDAVAAIEAAAARLLDQPRRSYGDDPVTVDRLLREVAASSPGVLRGLTEPVGALLRRCGLATHRDLVGTPLTDWRLPELDAAVWNLVSRRDWRDDPLADDDDPDDGDAWRWADDRRSAMEID